MQFMWQPIIGKYPELYNSCARVHSLIPRIPGDYHMIYNERNSKT